MLPLTETVPKPLLPVLDRPFLDYQIELLRSNNVHRFLLLVSHLGHLIEDHYRRNWLPGVEITYSFEQQPLGTGGALKHAGHLLDNEFLLLNGDTLLDIDYRRLVADFRSRQCAAMVVAYRNCAAQVASNLAVDQDGRVAAYDKTRPTGEYVDAGVTAVSRAAFGYFPAGERFSFEQDVFPKLIDGRELTAWPTDELFFDMGTPDGLRRLEAYLSLRQLAPK